MPFEFSTPDLGNPQPVKTPVIPTTGPFSVSSLSQAPQGTGFKFSTPDLGPVAPPVAQASLPAAPSSQEPGIMSKIGDTIKNSPIGLLFQGKPKEALQKGISTIQDQFGGSSNQDYAKYLDINKRYNQDPSSVTSEEISFAKGISDKTIKSGQNLVYGYAGSLDEVGANAIKSIAEDLAKETSLTKIVKSLESKDIPVSEIDRVAPDIQKATTPDEVRSIADTIKSPQQIGESSSQPESTRNVSPGSKSLPPTEEPSTQITPELSPSKDTSVPSNDRTTTNPNINSDTLNITPEAKTLLNTLQDDLSPKTAQKVGPVMTNKEVEDFAKMNPGLTLNQTTREASLKSNAALLQARQELAHSLDIGASNEDVIKNFFQVKTTLTDLGRSLQKASINADPESQGVLPRILQSIYKVNKNVDDILEAAKGVDFNDYNQAVKFYRQFIEPTAGDWIDLVRYNSMLSSPKTLANISLGNLGTSAIVRPIVKATAGLVDYLTPGEQTHFVGEGGAYLKGYFGSLREATEQFTNVMTGKLDPKMLDFSVPIATDGVKGNIVKAANFFSTLHNALYQFFNTLAKSGETDSLLFKETQGVKVPLLDATAQAGADYSTLRSALHPEGQGGLLNAIDSFAGMIKQARNSNNPWLSWPAKVTLPFITIANNMAKQMIEYSPVGFGTMIGAEDKTTQFTKAILGTAGFFAAAQIATTNNSTWSLPTDAKEKDAFLASGRQPYSVRIGNHWVSYTKLPPAISVPLALASAYVYVQSHDTSKLTTMDNLMKTVAESQKFFADESYVKNIGDAWATIQGDQARATSLISSFTQQFIPMRAFLGWLANLTDPNQREPNQSKGIIAKQFDSFMEQMPGLRETLPIRKDIQGQPIPNQNRFENSMNPLPTTNVRDKQEKYYSDLEKFKQNNRELKALKSNPTPATPSSGSGFKFSSPGL